MNCLAPLITQSPSSSFARGPRVAGVRAGLGLGQAERAELLAAAEQRQPLLLLLVGAERVDRPGGERRVGGDRDRHARVHARELLDHERVGERVGPAAAVLLGVGHAHQAQLAELGDDLVGEALLPVELLGHRLDLVLREVAREALDRLLLVGQVEVHAARDAIRRGGRWQPSVYGLAVERNTLLWMIVLFLGGTVLFGYLRRATEDSSTGVTVAVQVAALALVIGVLVVVVRRCGSSWWRKSPIRPSKARRSRTPTPWSSLQIAVAADAGLLRLAGLAAELLHPRDPGLEVVDAEVDERPRVGLVIGEPAARRRRARRSGSRPARCRAGSPSRTGRRRRPSPSRRRRRATGRSWSGRTGPPRGPSAGRPPGPRSA